MGKVVRSGVSQGRAEKAQGRGLAPRESLCGEEKKIAGGGKPNKCGEYILEEKGITKAKKTSRKVKSVERDKERTKSWGRPIDKTGAARAGTDGEKRVRKWERKQGRQKT